MSQNRVRPYRVEHSTAYRYSEPAMLSHQQLHLTPRLLDYQQIHAHESLSNRRRRSSAKLSTPLATR